MNLAKIKAEIKDIEQKLADYKSSNYRCSRDDDGNLIVNFENGDQVKLPVVPFRTYQLEAQHALFIEGLKRFFIVRPRRAGKEVEESRQEELDVMRDVMETHTEILRLLEGQNVGSALPALVISLAHLVISVAAIEGGGPANVDKALRVTTKLLEDAVRGFADELAE